MRWAPWPRHRLVECVWVERDGRQEPWLVAWGPVEELDLLTPQAGRGRDQPLYAQFLSHFPGHGSLEDMAKGAVEWARGYGLLGLFHREYPYTWTFGHYAIRRKAVDAAGELVRLADTPYAQVARYLSRRSEGWPALEPWQVEPMSGWLGAHWEISAAVGLETDPATVLEGRGEWTVRLEDGRPVVELRYRSLLDGMLLRAAYDRLLGARPLQMCPWCGRWFLPARKESVYCSADCQKAAANRRTYLHSVKPRRMGKVTNP